MLCLDNRPKFQKLRIKIQLKCQVFRGWDAGIRGLMTTDPTLGPSFTLALQATAR